MSDHKKEFEYDLQPEEAKLITKWLYAYFKKAATRKPIPFSVKQQLCEKQDGKCAVCGEELELSWSKIHVDHIIPWVLVGDELEDNYQVLCDTCN